MSEARDIDLIEDLRGTEQKARTELRKIFVFLKAYCRQHNRAM